MQTSTSSDSLSMRLGSKSASSSRRFRCVCENARNWLGRGPYFSKPGERQGRTLEGRKEARWGELTAVNEAPARHGREEAASNSRLNSGKTGLDEVIYEARPSVNNNDYPGINRNKYKEWRRYDSDRTSGRLFWPMKLISDRYSIYIQITEQDDGYWQPMGVMTMKILSFRWVRTLGTLGRN